MILNINRRKTVNVASLAEASAAIRAAWKNLSGTAFGRDPVAGLLAGDDGVAFAHISYNGRAWKGTDKHARSEEIKA